MIQLTVDPADPNKLTLTATVTLFLNRLVSDVLSEEVSAQVRAQAKKDLQSNRAVKKAIADAAQRLLLGLLGVAEQDEPDDHSDHLSTACADEPAFVESVKVAPRDAQQEYVDMKQGGQQVGQVRQRLDRPASPTYDPTRIMG